MKLKMMNDDELVASIEIAVQRERESLTDVLNHIVEVERRKLYLKKGYPSLYAYLIEHLKYSNGTAYRRIEAARLMKDFPLLPENLETGELNLAQVTIVQKAIRQKKKETRLAISKDEKCNLMNDLVGKSETESEKIVAQALDLEVKGVAKLHTQKDESVRLEITFTKDQWQKLNRMRELLSTSLPDGSWDEVFTHVAEKVIEQKTRPPKRATPSNNHIKESTKRAVLQRDQCCQQKNPKTQKLCGSKWNLQVDHIQPLWAGGSHEMENLQALCARHNRYRYREQSGIHVT